MAYILGDFPKLYERLVKGYESIPVGRRTLLTTLSGVGLYALGRETIPRLIQPRTTNVKANATTPVSTNSESGMNFIETLNAYRRATRIQGHDPTKFIYFESDTGITRAVIHYTDGQLEFLKWFPNKLVQYTKESALNGSVDKAISFIGKDEKEGDSPSLETILTYARPYAISVGDIPKNEREILQAKHRDDVQAIKKNIERELIKMVKGSIG